MKHCQDCAFFQIDYVGNKGALHGSCLIRDMAWAHGGWRNGSAKACKEFTPDEEDRENG